MYKVHPKRLGDVVNFKRGYDLPSYARKSGKFPIISSGGLSGYHNDFKAEGEGIITGRYGTLGEMYYVNGKYWPHNTALYVQNFFGNYPKYVYYLLKCLGNLKTSDKSTVPGINRNDLHEVQIPFIDKEFQKPIADFLSVIDAKIDLNNRINSELEGMAKLIYDYWFVQFDFPISEVQAAAMGRPELKGKPYKSSGGKMVFNKELKREVPEGWEVKELGTELEIQRGISYKSSEIKGEGIPMINLNSFNLNGTYKAEGVKMYSGKYQEKNLVSGGDLLIAMTDVTRNADIIGRAIIVPDSYKELVCSMDVAKVIPSKRLTESYVMMLFNTIHYHNYIKWFASGTIVLHLNLDGMKWYNAELPPQELLEKFDHLYNPVAKRINETTIQNQKLSELRDWLLPMLMNGQVRVVGDEGEVRMAAEPGVEYK